jgi:V/A-type H+-transporting ATPase subunit C
MVDYTYIVARLNALEAEMPDRSWFQRLAGGSAEGLLGSIREYFDGFENVGSLYDFEKGLVAEKRGILELLSKLISEEGTIRFLRAGYDFDNMCFLWKARKRDEEPVFNSCGLVDPEEIMVAAVGNDDIRYLPDYLKELYQKLESRGDGISPVELEQLCERSKWKFVLHSAPSHSARSFTQRRIDIINIKNFIRLKRTGSIRDNIDSLWLEGGEIGAERFRSFFNEPDGEFLSYLETTDYRNLIKQGLDTSTPLWRIDILLMTFLIQVAGQSRYRYFDISPVLYHLLLRERNEQLIRTLITCKLNEFPEDMISERLDELLMT